MEKEVNSAKVEETLIVETTEKIQNELDVQSKVAEEILAKQEEERIRKTFSNPSAIALESTKTSTGEGLGKLKKSEKELFTLYLTNQFVARAVNIRADTLISQGYKLIDGDKEGVEACQKLIEDSGGINLFWQLSVNTDISGNGFLEKIYNQSNTKILRLKHVHPLTLSFKKDLNGKIIVGEDKEPISYEQIYLDEQGMEQKEDVPKEIIAHLKFNTLGDEFTGISTIQPGYNTIVRLMNMEYSAAEAAVKTANPLIVGKTNTKSPHQIAQWGLILGRISGRDQVFLPEGMTLEFMSPGAQNFSDYAEYFLDAVVATFGVPKGVLLGSSGSGGNRAEGIVLTRHFYSVIRSNQRYMSDFFYKIFQEYAEIAGFKAPKLEFEDIAEDASILADSATKLYEAELITREEARSMIGLDERSSGSFKQGLSADLKKSDREVQFPESPGKPVGSQVGIKKRQKVDPFSEVSNVTS